MSSDKRSFNSESRAVCQDTKEELWPLLKHMCDGQLFLQPSHLSHFLAVEQQLSAMMDWQSSMGMFQAHDEEQQDEDNEDFYGNGAFHDETKAGAAEHQEQDVGTCCLHH